MPLPKPAATAYFRAERRGVARIPMLLLSASEDGKPLWSFALEGSEFEECADALFTFLDAELERSVDPVFADSVFQAVDLLGLFYSPNEAVLAATDRLAAPEIDVADLALRLDRMRTQLEYLSQLVATIHEEG